MTEFEAWQSEQAARWLRHIRELKHDISRLEDEVETLRSLALPQGIDYSTTKVTTSPTQDTIPNAVIKLDEMTRRYCTELVAYLDEKKDANDRIKLLEDSRYRAILHEYYINAHSWKEVAEIEYYSIEYCKTLRSASLPFVYQVMPIDWKTPIPRAD